MSLYIGISKVEHDYFLQYLRISFLGKLLEDVLQLKMRKSTMKDKSRLINMNEGEGIGRMIVKRILR